MSSVHNLHKIISKETNKHLLNLNIGKDMINQLQLNINYMELSIIMEVWLAAIILPLQLIMTINGLNLMTATYRVLMLIILLLVQLIFSFMKELIEVNDLYIEYITLNKNI